MQWERAINVFAFITKLIYRKVQAKKCFRWRNRTPNIWLSRPTLFSLLLRTLAAGQTYSPLWTSIFPLRRGYWSNLHQVNSIKKESWRYWTYYTYCCFTLSLHIQTEASYTSFTVLTYAMYTKGRIKKRRRICFPCFTFHRLFPLEKL